MAAAAAGRDWDGLLPELLCEIRGRLAVHDRAAFAAVCSAWAACKQEAPCLVLPGVGDAQVTICRMEARATAIYSLADRKAAAVAVRPSGPVMRDHIVVGSSGGWLVTADHRGAMRVANPVTGEQSLLPDITTIPFISTDEQYLYIDIASFAQVRFGGGRIRTEMISCTTRGVRCRLYRKVVLSHCRRAAMLILQDLQGDLGAPAFATTEEGAAWRVAPYLDGVEDAMYHNGQFYSITYSGVVETWARRRAGSDEFTSSVVSAAPPVRPDNKDEDHLVYFKYLAAAPDGRLMVLFRYKNSRVIDTGARVLGSTRLFKVYVLVDGEWKETAEIGDVAVFVGVNGALCVPAREYRELRAGCVYFTEDNLRDSWRLTVSRETKRWSRSRGFCLYEEREVGVYSLEDGTVEPIEAMGSSWPPAAWFTPSFA